LCYPARVLVSILAQVAQDLSDSSPIDFDDEVLCIRPVDDGDLAGASGCAMKGAAHEFAQQDFFGFELHRANIEPADFKEIFDQVFEPAHVCGQQIQRDLSSLVISGLRSSWLTSLAKRESRMIRP